MMKVFETIFPSEIASKLFLYNSNPVSDLFKNAFLDNVEYCENENMSFYDAWIEMKELHFIADRTCRRDRAFEIQLAIRTRLKGAYRETYDEWCDKWEEEEETYEQYKERIYYSR